MNLETRKINIISWVSHLQDENLLTEIEKLQSKKQDWWYLLSYEEKEDVEQGMAEADRGELKSTEDVLAKYKK